MRSPVYLMIFLLLVGSAFAASVTRNMPARADPSSVVTVTFTINDATPGEAFTLEDQLPSGLTVSDWSVSGSQEPKADITTRFSAPRYGWSFTPSGSSATITYTVTAPSAEGSYTFDAVWFDKSGQSRSSQALQVRSIRCGDGICEGNENSNNCQQDCPVATTQPATTRTIAPVTTTLKSTGTSGNNTLAIVLVLILVILVIILLVVRKKRKATEFPEIKELDKELKHFKV